VEKHPRQRCAMSEFYYWCETVVLCWVVIVALGIVAYLAQRQIRTMQLRRWHRRHKARRKKLSSERV
jgi:predicted membrane-bound mannosyltransferase